EDRLRLLGELQQLTKDLEDRVEARTRSLRENEARYRALFDDSPISLWEEDFTEATAYLEELRSAGAGDLRAYFKTHPDAVATAAGKVKILAVNQATLTTFEAETEAQFLEGLSLIFGPDTYDALCEGLLGFLEGRTS